MNREPARCSVNSVTLRVGKAGRTANVRSGSGRSSGSVPANPGGLDLAQGNRYHVEPAGAPDLAPDHWSEAESRIRDAGEKVEDGDQNDARERASEAARAYRRAERTAVRADVLGLTAEQEAQLDALRGDPEARTPLLKDYDVWKASLAEILNEEQLEIAVVHAALRAKMRAKRMERRGPHRGWRGPHGGRFGG